VFYTYSQGRRLDILTGDFPLNATAPRVVLSNGRAVADPFFNTRVAGATVGYPRARKRDVDMLATDDSHLVNLRVHKTIALPNRLRIELSADVFNLFISGASIGFLSVDDRSANFGVRDSYVAARVGQIGARFTF
jgi:hypothetical protein